MALVWDEEASAPKEKNLQTGKVVCPSCGVTNSPENVLCIGCGTNLSTATSLTQSRTASKKIAAGSSQEAGKKRSPGKRLESWKTLFIAGALVVLVILGIG